MNIGEQEYFFFGGIPASYQHAMLRFASGLILSSNYHFQQNKHSYKLILASETTSKSVGFDNLLNPMHSMCSANLFDC